MGLIWGIPYLLIKIAVDELEPASLVLGRTAIGALMLLPLAAMRDQLRPVLKYWRPLLVFAIVEICIPWLMLGFAEQRLSSSLTGLLIAAVPLVGAVMVKATGHETLGWRRVSGLLIGLAGVSVLVGFDVGSANAFAVVAVAVVAICYAAGPLLLAKYLSELPGLGVVASSLLIAAILYTPVGVAQWPTSVSADTVGAVIALAVVCTATAFLVFFKLIAEVGPARATVITYINPAVALTLGVIVLNENVSFATGVGFALILAGSVLATSKDREPATANTS
jgi:drug/metabolite transporter (DMT)-like permease